MRWREYVSIVRDLKKIGMAMKLIFKLLKIQLEYLVHIMKKDGAENLALIGHGDLRQFHLETPILVQSLQLSKLEPARYLDW